MCKQALTGKIAGHQAINDVIACAITAAGVPVTKEPVGLTRLGRGRFVYDTYKTVEVTRSRHG